MKKKQTYYIINSITIYRIVAAPLLVLLIFTDVSDLFKWLLAFSFFTDLIDGFLAREFKVTSAFGSQLDSIADDLTIIAAIIGVFVFKPNFIKEESEIIIVLFVLFAIQTVLALLKYGKISSFHTYAAKCSAILQGLFLILIFFFSQPLYVLFYIMAFVTSIELIEEIVLVILLHKWETNVKGLYWVLKRGKSSN